MSPQIPTTTGQRVSRLKLVIFLLIFTTCAHIFAQRKAFPTAYGAGSETTGGAGGVLVIVNTLNPNTPITYNASNNTWSGGFKDACNNATIGNSGRIIIFSVSGNIDLGGTNFDLYRHNVTILGQSAPEGGITLHNGTFRLNSADNVIVRYIRCRNGLATQAEMNGSGNSSPEKSAGISVVNGCTNIILDHVSASWGADKAILLGSNQPYDQNNQTVQRCLISDSHTMMQMSCQNPDLYDDGLRSDLSCYLNMFARGNNRTPNIGGTGGYIDVINNVVQSGGSKLGVLQIIDNAKVNWARNWTRYMGGGASTANSNEFQMNYSGGTYYDDLQLYARGNYYKNNSGVILDGTENIDRNDNLAIWSYRMGPSNIPQDTPMPLNMFTVDNEFDQIINKPPTRTASEAYTSIVTERNAGACHYITNDGTVGSYLDSWDADLFTNLEAETMQEHHNVSNWILPNLPQNSRPDNFSSIGDGIEDNWRAANMNGQAYDDIAPSGYMWIEEFYNQVDVMETGEVTVNQIAVSSDATNDTICEGDTVTLTATGADSYIWSPGNLSGDSIEVSPTSNVTYSVTGTHSDNTTSTTSIAITVNMIPVANAGNDEEICQGESVTLSASGGTSYLWSSGQTTQSITVSPDTTFTYSVTVTENDCTSDPDDVTVTVNPTPDVDAGEDQTITLGESVQLTANGADSYLWNTGETTQSITVSPLIETTYTVTGTSGSCQDSDAVTVFIVGNEVVANAGEDQTICSGSTATLTASGGVAYVWSTGETTESIEVSPNNSTTYTVTAYDATGLVSDTDDVTVNVLALPNVDAGNDVTINEGESVTLTASGATTYLWSTGEDTASIEVNPNSDTTYTVSGYSNANCESTDEITVFVQTETVVANAGDDVSICQGDATTLTASGGASYLWNTGEDTASIVVSPDNSTTYTVTVFNALGTVSDTDDVVVTVNALPNVDAGNDVTINEGESVTLTASGTTTYLWSTGEDTASIEVNPNSDTTYTVTGYSNANCESTDEVTVFVQTETVVANAGDDVSICQGEATTLTASGGASYLWNTGEDTASIVVSPDNSTTYTVTVFNALGTASDTDDVVVTVNALPIANAGTDVNLCEGNSTLLTASGGTTYLWSTGQTSQSIEVAPNTTTTYTVEVFENNCSSFDEVTVIINALPNVDAGSDVTITEGEFVILSASGADSYEWSTGETGANIEVNPTSTTTYSVTGFSNGCESTDAVTVVVETETVNANAGEDVSICEGASTILTATGGTSYEWSTGETTPTIEVAPNVSTTYTVTVFNTLGTASDTDDVLVTVNALPIANAGADVELCEGNSTILTASGGTTYLWSTGETSQSIEVAPNTTTTYAVEVFENNCSSFDEVTVIINPLPDVNAGNDVVITEGDSTTLTATGADTYEWSTGETSQSIEVTPNTTTTYSVIGFVNGCQSTDDVTVVVEPIVFEASAGEDQFICEGTETILTASEGDAYLWNNGETTQSITVYPWSTETYTVTVFEGDEQDDDEVTVFVNLNPNVVIMNGGEVDILEGEFVTLSASGANAYEWSNGATQPNIAVSPSNTTTFSVTGFVNNCADTKSVTINVYEEVVADAGEDQYICSNESIVLTASGGDEYLWSNGETTPSIVVSPNEDTEYSVLVFNALDAAEDTVMVFVDNCDTPEMPPITNQPFDFIVYQDAYTDVLKVQISGLNNVNVNQIEIYDITGKRIYTEMINQEVNQASLDKEINSAPFSRGIYIVRLLYDDTEIIKKIPIR